MSVSNFLYYLCSVIEDILTSEIEIGTSEIINLFMDELTPEERYAVLSGMHEQERKNFLVELFKSRQDAARKLDIEMLALKISTKIRLRYERPTWR